MSTTKTTVPQKPTFTPVGEQTMLQAKLRIGSPNDAYEREADRVAEQVMRMPEPNVQRKCAECEEHEKKTLRRSENGIGPEHEAAPPIVHDVLGGSGRPLDPSVRSFMEPRFGHDFSNVRIHTDERAAESARSINAFAYTAGRDVVFGAGQYQPGSQSGRRLIAHELQHVRQQGGGLMNKTIQPAREMSKRCELTNLLVLGPLGWVVSCVADLMNDGLTSTARKLIELYLENLISSGNIKLAMIALTIEFVLGIGPTKRNFGSDHALTQSLKSANITTVALKKFWKEYLKYKNGERSFPASYRVDFSPILFHGNTGPVREFLADGAVTTAQFTGTAHYFFALSNNKKTLNIVVWDTKTEYSLLLHFPGTDRHTRSESRIMGKTTQYYMFSMPLTEVESRAK